MASAAERFAAITDTVNRYIAVLADGGVDELVDLYADDATLEDPVGGEVHIGRRAIHGFYAAITGHQRDSAMRVEPIEVMVFDQRGKVKAMKA